MTNPDILILPEPAIALRKHAAVRDAIACRFARGNDQGVVGFVLADDKYLDGVLGRKEVESNQIRKWRKTYDLSQLTKTAATSPFAFNTAGWNSSYTRQPIPAEDMREWVQTTIDRISELRVSDVLEIGCGTGLLLLRLAHKCQKYVGVDFSGPVLMRLREQLARAECIRGKVDLLERSADNFEGFAENSFTAVVLNSVAQYFPNLAYLDRVMENAIRVIKPGGNLFVGDLRSLPLLETQALSIEAFEATPMVSVAELLGRVSHRMQSEPELVLSPSYFLSLQQRFPKISRVEIFLRRGDCDNEMNRFRYDAILRVGADSIQTSRIPFLDPPAGGWGVGEVRSFLGAGSAQGVGFARVGNSRIKKYAHLRSRLASANPAQVFDEFRNEGDQCGVRGIHPEEIFRIAVETGHNAAVSWASCYADGSYDAAFARKSSPEDEVPPFEWPQPRSADFVHFANTPGQAETRKKLVEELSSHCHMELCHELVPRTLYVVDSFPRTTDGSADCEALLSSIRKAAHHSSS